MGKKKSQSLEEIRTALLKINRTRANLQKRLLQLQAKKTKLLAQLQQHPELLNLVAEDDITSAFLEEDISKLGISVRTQHCLRAEEINTIRELISKTSVDLLRTTNIGRKTLNEIREALAGFGFKLKGSPA